MKLNRKFSTMFMKFMMPYLIIILMMACFTSVAYFIAFNEIESNALKMQESYMEQSKSVLDRRFNEAIDASLQLSRIPIVNGFQVKTEEELEDDYFTAFVLYHSLKDVRFVNDIIEEYFIFYKNSGIVASSSVVNYYKNLSPKTFDIEGYDRETYWNYLFSKHRYSELQPVEEFKIYTKDFTGIPILTTIGVKKKSPEAVVLMILDSEKLKEDMIGFEHNVGGNFFIADEVGNILISLNEEVGISKDRTVDFENLRDGFITFSAQSEVTDWTYYMTQPSTAIFDKINQMRNTATLLIVIIFLVGLVTSAMSASYNSKPIHNLITSHDHLQERVKNQLPYLRMTFLERWLKGNYTNIDELISLTKYLKTSYLGRFYCVMVIDYDERIDVLEDLNDKNINELEMKRLIVKDLLTEDILRQDYVHAIDHDKLAVIFVSNENTKEHFELYLNKCVRACMELLKGQGVEDIHYGIGSIYCEMSDVSTSLSDALDALTTISSQSDREVVWYDELSEDQDSYYYPPELEVKLYNCTRAGDHEQTEQILRDVLRRNLFEKTLPMHMLQVFIYEIWGTLAKIQEKAIGEESEVRKIIVKAFEQIGTMSELESIQYCRKTFLDVCEATVSDKNSKHDALITSINDYIKDNFTDPDLCLPMIADEFNISYTYLSQIFKDFNNESFSNYLQHLRMEEAQHLLVTTKMTVNAIVLASGYNSSNTFGKAFKRIHGVSASAYRRNKRLVKVDLK